MTRALRIEVNGTRLHARVTDSLGMDTRGALERATGRPLSLVNEIWSGAFVTTREAVGVTGTFDRSAVAPYQYPGGIYFLPEIGKISICYGAGRLQDGLAPLAAMLVGEIVESVPDIEVLLARAQLDGALSTTIDWIDESYLPSAPPEPKGTRLRLTLDDAVAEAVLFDDRFPTLIRSLKQALPIQGTASNTHSSGPLTRIWNEKGGQQGITRLECSDDELSRAQAVLYPRHLYYLPKATHAGFRIPVTEPGIMRSPVGGPGLTLLGFGRLVGDLTEVAEVAARLQVSGAVLASLELA